MRWVLWLAVMMIFGVDCCNIVFRALVDLATVLVFGVCITWMWLYSSCGWFGVGCW